MKDTELDRLLDSWNAPAPPATLREGLRERFPRAERRRFARPLRWAMAIVVASIALAFGMAQTSESQGSYRIVRILDALYNHLLGGIEAHQASRIVAQVRQSAPKVYVDGQLVAPLEYGPATRMDVQVPGDGVYSIMVYRFMQSQTADGIPTGWVAAGQIHGSVIEFQAGGRQVRIECNQPIVDSDRPVFVRRRP